MSNPPRRGHWIDRADFSLGPLEVLIKSEDANHLITASAMGLSRADEKEWGLFKVSLRLVFRKEEGLDQLDQSLSRAQLEVCWLRIPRS
jgi:hypothetical protein